MYLVLLTANQGRNEPFKAATSGSVDSVQRNAYHTVEIEVFTRVGVLCVLHVV